MKLKKNLGEVVGVEGNIKIDTPAKYIPLLFQGPNGKEIGRFEFEGDTVVFKGKANEAAQMFFEMSKDFIDKYIKEQLKEK